MMVRILLMIIILVTKCYGFTNLNKLLDIGILIKKNGKAVVLIFDKPAQKADWRIRFKDKRLDIELYGFISLIKKDDLLDINIPGLEKVGISQGNNNIKISFLLEENTEKLISNGSLTFLTKVPNMLGIMFTGSYINKHIPAKFSEKLSVKTAQKASESPKEINQNKVKNSNMDIPFVNYEEIFALDTKDSSKELKNKMSKNEILKEKLSKEDNFRTNSINHGRKRNEIDLFKVIASLSAVLGIILLTLFSWKRLLFFRYKGKQDIIKVIGAHHFSSRQSIVIVQIYKEKFLLGVTPENITLLTKLTMQGSQDHGMREYNLPEEDTLGQKVVNILRERIDQLKRI